MKVNIIKTGIEDIKEEVFVTDNNVLYKCNATGTVIVPKGITIIGSNVFANKSNVTKVVLPEGLKTIGINTFIGCTSLEEVIIPESVEAIEDQAFFGCKKLKKVHLPKNLKRLCIKAFTDSGLESVDLPEHPDYVGLYVFANSQLHQVTIPANFPLTVAMFDECKNLETVTFEGTGVKVPGICFKLCENLKNIDLRSIKTIGKGGFLGCKSLDFDVLPKDIRVNDSAFSGCGIKHITVENLNSIEGTEKVFYECCQLTKAVIDVRGANIPQDVKEIPQALFSHCINLEKVLFTGMIGKITSIGFAAFEDTALKKFTIPENIKKIDSMAFFKTEHLAEITLPEKLKTICRQAFSESGLKSITLPDSVEFVETECFRDCCNLEEVTLPAKEFVVPDGMFMSCEALKKVNNADKIVQLGKYAFYGTDSLKQIDLSSAADIGGNAFECSGLTSVKLSKCCKILDSNAFYKCKNLKLADLSESSIEYFAPYIFYRCGENKLMTEVILPDKVWNVDECAFVECYIKNLNVTADVSWKNVMISENAFTDASIDMLTFVDNPDGHVYLNESAFKNAFIGELTIPDYLYDKYKNVWDNVRSAWDDANK
jgi:hypothetical protein